MSDPADTSLSPRPMVARTLNNRGVWLFGAAMAVAAVVMVTALEKRRAAQINRPQPVEAQITAPPDVQLPQIAAPSLSAAAAPSGIGPDTTGGFVVPGRVATMPGGRGMPARVGIPVGAPRTLPGVPTAPRLVGPDYSAPATVTVPSATKPLPASALTPPVEEGRRIMATQLSNPSVTVVQGATIQAVLETALDSNRPGYARAVVARDVRGFDGSKVLIQRGSKLFGEYQNDVAQGQSHIAINWTMLTRPDGVQIALASPVTGALGQAGVKGKVNSHFLSRFGGMILQSTLDVGVGLATRSATGGAVILGLPGSTTSAQGGGQQAVKPTITVKQGTPVAVLVIHDLDFSTVER